MMLPLKKLYSYLFPLTIRKVTSMYNGTLEITLSNGRKILDSQNANYSYGSLQRILEYALSEIELRNIKSVLLLGLGAGSVIVSLREKFQYTGNIVAIEVDPVVIDIAKEFGINAGPGLQIIQHDASEYLKSNNEKYDLVIADLFIDDQIPSQFYSKSFCDNLVRAIASRGTLIFNLGLTARSGEKHLAIVKYFKFQTGFEFVLHENVDGTNAVLIASGL